MTEQRVAGGLDKGFARLAAMRKLFAVRNPQDIADYGRSAAAAWVARSAAPIPANVHAERIEGPYSGLRITPPEPGMLRMLYIHGGGLVYYDSSVFLPFLANLAVATGMEILAVDYPKAPENAASEILAGAIASAEAALRLSDGFGPGRPTLVAGDSVGAVLAMLLALGPMRERFAEMHLIYPVADAGGDYPERYATGHFLDAAMMRWFSNFIAPLFGTLGGPPCNLPREVLADLPPCTIHLAECDILHDEGHALARRCDEAGILRDVIVHEGLPHDFCLYSGAVPAAGRGVDLIAGKVRRCAPA